MIAAGHNTKVATCIGMLVGMVAGASLALGAASHRSEVKDLPLRKLSDRALKLADKGELSKVLRAVEDIPLDAASDPDELAALKQDIQTHQELRRARRKRVRRSFENTVDDMVEQMKQGHLSQALTSAVQAHELATSPEKFRHRQRVRELVRRARERAQKARNKHRWLQALSIYSRLNELFAHTRRYAQEVERTSRRIWLLRLYAPDVLYQLRKERAMRMGEKPPQPWAIEDDHWRKELEKIESEMLRDALILAQRRHVEDVGFDKLLIGGIDALLTMLHTPGLETTFSSLGDQKAVTRFAHQLREMRQKIRQEGDSLTLFDARHFLKRILRLNLATVSLPEAVIVHQLGQGVMGQLDKFSTIIWPHQKERFERTTSGSFSGVGIRIKLDQDRRLTVVSPLEGTPAQRAGVRPGDRIVTINGKSTLGMTLDKAVEQITGPIGTEVTLGLKHPGSEKVREVTLTRSKIEIVSVKGWDRRPGGEWSYMIAPDANIGYVRLLQFGPETADELDRAVRKMRHTPGGVDGLILDLRFNPGGLLSAAVAVADRFLDQGVIVSTDGQPGIPPKKLSADAMHTYPEQWPVIVLVNSQSASASEIVAGALQDHDRALILGERTYGKGSVQNLIGLGGGKAYLKLTTQYYRLPDGEIIHRRPGDEKWGIQPDVRIEMTDRQVIELLEARRKLDVLRKAQRNKTDAAPQSPATQSHADHAPDAQKQTKSNETGTQKYDTPLTQAKQILKRGLDPQLEAAVLLLRTKLLGQEQQ